MSASALLSARPGTFQKNAAQFISQGAVDAPLKSVRPERSEGFDSVDSSSPSQFMAQGQIHGPLKSVCPERSEGFDAVDSSNPSLRSGRTGSRVSRVAAVALVSRVAAAPGVAKAAQ